MTSDQQARLDCCMLPVDDTEMAPESGEMKMLFGFKSRFCQPDSSTSMEETYLDDGESAD
jgi:hypothetical protein